MKISEDFNFCIFSFHINILIFKLLYTIESMNVGSCHHGMARPRIADGGTASNMEGSCE